ncbi:MAG TPA: hypothetical protein VGP27_12405 [Mycobacterium sp.]|nr:hypothetical protein [Mycobacterium sp.]
MNRQLEAKTRALAGWKGYTTAQHNTTSGPQTTPATQSSEGTTSAAS